MSTRTRHHTRWLLAGIAAIAVVVPASAVSETLPQLTWRQQTVVSLTFDDGAAGQARAASILSARNLDATFFVNSGTIGLPGYLTLDQLRAFASAGHEIGGHSVTHPDLAALPADEVARQICNDRVRLSEWGFEPRSFAYPFASTTPAVEEAVEACGYNSARMLGDVRSRFGCPECDYAETMPPENPYYTKALDQFDSTWTLQDLKNAVTNAERNGGGWVQFTFHDVCTTTCGQLDISTTVLSRFGSWLRYRTLLNTVVKPVGEVIGGGVQPAAAGPAVPPPDEGNALVNAGLEDVDDAGVPVCWMRAPWGTNSPTFSVVSPGRTGSIASRIVMTDYTSGDAKIIPTFDLGACAPSVAPGSSYVMRAWYTSTTVTQFAVYLRTTDGGWVYWTSSPWFPSADQFTEAVWTTPAIPDGYDGISFGLNIFSDGELVTDDYELTRAP